ncbi:MAG: type II toxin-antitoxin system MqsA family antitoxin [Patescibacteria group bacterium]
MSIKSTQPHTRCAVCGGALRETTITHEERRGDRLYLFQNVPAKVCVKCGEIWIDENTFQQMDRLIKEDVPVRTVETPVYNFPRAPMTAR